MAVYEHTYKPYDGPLVSLRRRWLVVPRYAVQEVFGYRFFQWVMLASVLTTIGFGAFLVVRQNADILSRLSISVKDAQRLTVGGTFFKIFLNVQGFGTGLLLALLAGPTLISADLRNNALPLYLSRPLNRWQYLLGKGMVLFGILSAVTWIPGLLLFGLQGAVGEDGWLLSHLSLGWGVGVGGLLLAFSYTLLALAISAVVKWKPLAGGAIFGATVIGGPVGLAINTTLDVHWGGAFSFILVFQNLWSALLDAPFVGHNTEKVAPGVCVVALFALWVICFLLLNQRVKACEVVR